MVSGGFSSKGKTSTSVSPGTSTSLDGFWNLTLDRLGKRTWVDRRELRVASPGTLSLLSLVPVAGPWRRPVRCLDGSFLIPPTPTMYYIPNFKLMTFFCLHLSFLKNFIAYLLKSRRGAHQPECTYQLVPRKGEGGVGPVTVPRPRPFLGTEDRQGSWVPKIFVRVKLYKSSFFLRLGSRR